MESNKKEKKRTLGKIAKRKSVLQSESKKLYVGKPKKHGTLFNYTHTHTHTHIHTHIYTYAHTHTYTYAHIHVHIGIQINRHASIDDTIF